MLIVCPLFTFVVFSSISYRWPSQVSTAIAHMMSCSILYTIRLFTRAYGHLVPWSYPLRGLRLCAVTILAHIHIRTPTSLSFRLVNTTSTCSSKSIDLSGTRTTCPNTPDVVGCKVSSSSRPRAAVPPMSIPNPSQAQTLPSQTHQYFRDRDHKSDILHSVACGISFLSSRCPHWPLLQSCRIWCDSFRKWWVVWRDHSWMSLMQVILELPV